MFKKNKENTDSNGKDVNLNIQVESGGGFFRRLFGIIFFVGIAGFTYNYLSSQNNVFYPDLIISDYGIQYEMHNKAFFEFNEKHNLSNTMETFDFPISNGKKIYYLEFSGDVAASQVATLRKEIDAILQVAAKTDEVVINLTSPGGSVTGYGLVASQLERLKTHNINLTVVVDQVAASGGYMAAVIADKIIAAPFAMVGSIGVVANVPIMEELFSKIGVDYRTYTAGDHKRTVSTYKTPSKEEEAKLNEKLQSIHDQFKSHVLAHRPIVNQNLAMNGDYFSGNQAMELGLIDEISTSDEYLRNKFKDGYKILKIKFEGKEKSKNSFINSLTSSIISSIKEELQKDTISFH